MAEYNIKKTLRQCKRAAANGYKISMRQYRSLNETMRFSSDKIEKTLIDINSSPCYVSEATESLSDQLSGTRELLDYLSLSLNEDINDLRAKLSTFSITLFGKTMAGKSTLMETLTEGNGESIGKGSQRTTRDIRTYLWNNLEITDVPGIGAFEGEDDEQIAFSAARKADLIIFLITDDAPQAAEAECLSEVIELGKPVICVLNVKSSMRDDENIKMTLRNIEKAFDLDRLETLKKQFMAYAALGGEVWDDIPVISVHLKAAFMSQRASNPQVARELYQASHIDSLKAKIIEEVETHGKYYREKNFVDIVSVSTLDIYENLLYQSYVNNGLSRIVRDKRNQLLSWISKYQRDSSNQIESLINSIDAELRMEIPAFAEEHFDDKDAASAWGQVLITKHVDERCKDMSKRLTSQADDRISELAREINNELTYTSLINRDKNINIPKMHRIFDAKKAWNWGALIAGGGLTIAGGVLYVVGSAAAGPVGWIALGVSVVGTIGSFIFKSRGKKEEQARKELEEHLQKNVSEICDSLRKQLQITLEKVIKERLNTQVDELRRIDDLIVYLSRTQRELAVGLCPNLLEQSKQILDAALRLVFGGWYSNRVYSAARIPGKMLVAQMEEGEKLPNKKVDRLNKLMQEELYFVERSDDTSTLLKRLFDGNVDIIGQENDAVQIVTVEDNSTDIKNRVRILQQFLGCFIENKKENNNA